MAFDNKKFLEKQRAQNEDTMMKLGFTEKSTTPQGQTKYSKPSLTPEEWERQSGLKLIDYSTDSSGNLSSWRQAMKVSDWEKKQAEEAEAKAREARKKEMAEESEARSSGLLKSAYEQVMGRAAGGTQGLFQGDTRTLGEGGFFKSMPQLEAASMRLADAALKREMLAGEYRGAQETGLQKIRGEQERNLQQLRGGQEFNLQQLRGGQESSLMKEGFGMEQSAADKERKRSEIKQEIARLERQIELERANPNILTKSNIGNLESGIQGLRSKLSNLDRS